MNDTIIELQQRLALQSETVAKSRQTLEYQEQIQSDIEDQLDAADQAELDAQFGPWQHDCNSCTGDATHWGPGSQCHSCGWKSPVNYSIPPSGYKNWLSEERT